MLLWNPLDKPAAESKLNRWIDLGLFGGRIFNPYKSPATKIGGWLLMISLKCVIS